MEIISRAKEKHIKSVLFLFTRLDGRYLRRYSFTLTLREKFHCHFQFNGRCQGFVTCEEFYFGRSSVAATSCIIYRLNGIHFFSFLSHNVPGWNDIYVEIIRSRCHHRRGKGAREPRRSKKVKTRLGSLTQSPLSRTSIIALRICFWQATHPIQDAFTVGQRRINLS